MIKNIRLSHSAAEKFRTCGALYRYHYIDRIRPVAQGSALFFGSAVDDALNELLESKKEDYVEKDISPLESAQIEFVKLWSKQKTNKNIEYFKSDIDLSLLDEETIEAIKEFDPEVENHEEFLKECFDILKNKEKMCKEDQALYNNIAWWCLLEKGKMLITAYNNDIMPQIHTVFDIQKKVELPDEHGNLLIGYIDAIVSFIDAPDRKVILDNKTSSKSYKDDSVRTSPQLATYCESENIEYGGYAVVEKAIRKREPRTRTQLIIDKIPEKLLDETFEMYDNVLEGIENEEFDKNYDSGCFMFGRPCQYYRYCRTNGKDKTGLKKV